MRLFVVNLELHPSKPNILLPASSSSHGPHPLSVSEVLTCLCWARRLTWQRSEHKGDPARARQIQEQTLGCPTTALCQLS